jgi:uncharacterized membrane protein
LKNPGSVYYHPMFVHFPQALFPVAFGSFALYLATGIREFEVGAFVAAAFGAAISPITTITGFVDWKIRYKGYMTPVFRIKIIGAFVLIALSIPAVLLRLLVPDVAALPLSGAGWAYAALLAACVVTCVVLGYYGGKLVFH